MEKARNDVHSVLPRIKIACLCIPLYPRFLQAIDWETRRLQLQILAEIISWKTKYDVLIVSNASAASTHSSTQEPPHSQNTIYKRLFEKNRCPIIYLSCQKVLQMASVSHRISIEVWRTWINSSCCKINVSIACVYFLRSKHRRASNRGFWYGK